MFSTFLNKFLLISFLINYAVVADFFLYIIVLYFGLVYTLLIMF